MESILKIAVQKKGRLNEKSLKLLNECSIKLINGGGKLISVARNFPVELLLIRDDDIPQYVSDGVADIGIVGENEVLEKDKPLDIIEKLGFAGCRLSLAIPKEKEYEGVEFFRNKKIATSYPNILRKFLDDKGIDAVIHPISGSVEIAPNIGLTDAIFDIVSSGSTLISNGLKEVEVVMRSEAVLVANKNLDDDKKIILEDLLFRIRAVMEATSNKYILLNAPNESLDRIIDLIPGMKSPTILPLAQEGWSSVHSVITESDFWEVIGKLKENGAQGILVVPIEKMVV